MESEKFKPSYGFQLYFGIISLLAIGMISLLIGNSEGNYFISGFGVLLILGGLFSFTAYPKEIEITNGEAIVKRRILPDKAFPLSEFTDIGGTAIRFGRKAIPLMNMQNANELISIFQRLLDERKIQPSQFQGKLATEEALTSKALKISLIPGLLLGFAVNVFLESFLHLEISGQLVYGIIYLLVFLGIYFYLKNKTEMD